MSHWAEIDENNAVIRVTVGNNEDPIGDEGYKWLIDNLGGTWIKASYNTRGGIHYGSDGNPDNGTPVRKNYPTPGYAYDKEKDAFIPPQPFLSWTLNENSCLWEAPVPYPQDGKYYTWDEQSKNWIPYTQ